MGALSALSYSSLRAYLECPLRWKFLYVDRLPEAPRGYFSFGRTLHSVLEDLARPLVVPFARSTPTGLTQRTLEQFGSSRMAPESGAAPMGREEMLASYARHWTSEGYTSPDEEARYRSLGVELLSRYYQEFVADPPKPVAVEEHLEARWDDISIHGYVDRIDLTPSGGLEVLDYKTTRGLSHSDARTSDQLSFYQVLVEMNYPAPVESLALYDLRGTATLRVPSRTPAELDPLRRNVGEVADGMRAMNYEPTPGRHCQRCEFRERCPEFREVPEAERARLSELVDRFIRLRDEESRVDGELRRAAEELHHEAERLGVHRLPGGEGTALRRREEKVVLAPEAIRAALADAPEGTTPPPPSPEAIARWLATPGLDPELRRRLRAASRRSVRWFWELDTDGEGPRSRNR